MSFNKCARKHNELFFLPCTAIKATETQLSKYVASLQKKQSILSSIFHELARSQKKISQFHHAESDIIILHLKKNIVNISRDKYM